MFRSYTDCVRTIQDDSQSSSNICDAAGYVCDICPPGSTIFITESDVEIHRRSDHYHEIVMLRAQNRERFCTVCMKLQPNYSALISHMKTEHLLSSPTAKRVEREIYICDYCNNIFFNKDILDIHIQFRHLYTMKERKTRRFKCPRCVKTSSLVNVWFHLQKHDISSVSACDICLLTFPNRQQLHEHLKSHPFLYRCETCLYSTNKESLFNSHLDKHESRVIKRMRKVDRTVKKVFRVTKKDILVKFNIHNLLRGLLLPNILRICILCREICTDKIDMRIHVLKDHLFKETTVKIKYICACGEEFSNKILIKHHVFKLKGTHRILDEGEIPDTLNIEFNDEEEEEDDQPLYELKTLGPYQTNDTTNQTIYTDNHITPTNKEAEDTDNTIARLIDGQTGNNIVINTEKLAESGVIVITRVGNNEKDMDTQIMSSDSQEMITDSQEMITDSQEMITDSQKMVTDSQILASDCQKMITDSQIMASDSQKMITDSQNDY